MVTPYHVRLAVSQYGDQFRAELFTEDLGDTEGDVLTELPPSLAEWVPYLSQGAELPPDAARQLGKDLFATLLGQPENAKKWTEVLDRARKTNRPIRLLVDATTDAVRDLPYGLLCEPHDDWFLFRARGANPVRLVRILRRCSPRPLRLGNRPRVLVATAEPVSADVPAFAAAGHLKALCGALNPSADVVLVGADGLTPLAGLPVESTDFTPFTRATRGALKAALASEYDVIHLLAHGHGAGVLLCGADGRPAETSAAELAEWCGAGRVGLAFLQICKAGQTGGRGGFGGVAQQLLSPRGGNLAAVVASTFPLDAGHSTAAAAAFYRALAAGKSPEEALATDAAEAEWTWSFLELWARPGALGGTRPRAAFQFVSPYRGLSSFTERDADLFFGRRAELAELLHTLHAEPAVGVVGDSGSGKTSLLQAGLVHAVRRNGLAGLDRWQIVSLRPGYHPAGALLAGLRPGGQALPTPAALAAALRADDRPLLVIVDQFEEAFTLARDPEEVRAMTQALADLVAERPDRFRLVIGMRSEFLGQSVGLPGLSRLLRRPWVLRPPAADTLRDIVAGPGEHCGYTFQRPLADGHSAHATGLLDRILADPLLASGDGAVPSLPLLQFALERLWLKAVEAGSTEFTHAGYDALGGLASAIAQHAEATYQATPTATGLGAGARAVAEHVITALVSSRGTRQPRPRAALEAETGKPDAARAVIDYLVGERLLTVRGDPADPLASLVDVSHEAVVLHWARLRGWLAEDAPGRAMRDEFRTAAEKWEAGFAGVPPKSTRGLPGADVCRNCLAWIGTTKSQLSPVAAEFVAAMRGYLRRQRRTRQAVILVLGLLAAVAAGLALVADDQAAQAKQSEREAKRSEHEAQVRAATLALDRGIQTSEGGRARLGLLDMARALQACPPAASGPDAAALRKAVLTNLAGWSAHMLRLEDVRTFPRPAIATDPGGRVIACRLPAGAVQLYDIGAAPGARREVGRPIPCLTATSPTTFVWADVLPDGPEGWTVLVSNGSGRARLWHVAAGGQEPAPLGPEFPTGATAAAVLSPRRPNNTPGRRTVAAASDDTVYLYDAATGAAVGPPLRYPVRVYALAFSPDGSLLAVGCGRNPDVPGGAGGVFHLLDAATGAVKRAVELPIPVTCVGFSPDGHRVAAGGTGVTVWKTADIVNPAVPTFHLASVTQRHSPESSVRAVFHPQNADQLLLLNPSGGLTVTHPDETAFGSGERLSPQGWVVGAGFHADKARSVFTANSDGTVRLWVGSEPVPTGGPSVLQDNPDNKVVNGVLSVAVRPDGTAVAAGTRDGCVVLYPLDRAAEPTRFVCPPEPVHGRRKQVSEVEFSADGARVIAQDALLRVFVFDVPTAGAAGPVGPRVCPAAPGGAGFVAAVPDGQTVLFSADAPGVYTLADLTTGRKRCAIRVPEGIGPPPEERVEDGFLLRVRAVAFSPTRKRMAVAARNGKVLVFDTDTGARVAGPLEHPANFGWAEIYEVWFDPTGDRLLTRSPRGRGLWDPDTGRQIDYRPNRIGIQVSRFSPTGRFVLGGTNFNAGEVWHRNGRDALAAPLTHAGAVCGIAADPAEERVVTASYDHTARIWDVATGKPVSPPFRHTLGVSDANFTPNGCAVVTGSLDGTVRVWPVPVPLPDDEPRVLAWIETTTGLKVTASGGVLLTADEWKARRDELNRLGGPPGIIR